jgi:hypothetical protein
MLFSLVGAIFIAFKAWVIWWCWDVFGRYWPGELGGSRTFAADVGRECFIGWSRHCIWVLPLFKNFGRFVVG